MNELITELAYFKADTPREELEEWATLAEAEIDRMNAKEGAVYYLVLSEFHAVYLRDIQTGYEMLKRINVNMTCITDQIKVRRCFYKYLEGAYQFALEDLADIIDHTSYLASKKIAVDFFRRVFQLDQPTGQTKFKSKLVNRQTYEQDFLKALKYQRSGSAKLALEMHRAIFSKYGSISEVISYESAKHIDRLLQALKSRVEREELEEYRNAIRDYELKIENKNYFDMKFEFISRVLDFIDPENEEEEVIIDYQLAKNFVIQNLQKAIAKTTDKQALNSLKATLASLQENQKAGEEICYKFLGDKAYGKLLLQGYSSIPEKTKANYILAKKQQSKHQQKEKEDQEDNRPPSKSIPNNKSNKQQSKGNVSKNVKKSKEENFVGSVMIKINYNSGGYEERYFYVKEDFMDSKKLYFCSPKSTPSKSDDYYSLKGLKSMTLGKVSEALKRQECDQFSEDRCFTLKVNSEQRYQRNFYVKEKEDYQNWVALFEELLNSQKSVNSKMKKTRVLIS